MKHINSHRIAIETKYLPATNFKGARIKASTDTGHSITISYPHELSGAEVHYIAAKALCEKLGPTWTQHDLVSGETKNGYVFLFV